MIHLPFLPFYQFSPAVACSSRVWKMRKRKASEKGGGAGKKDKGSFLLGFFLVCAFSNSTDPTISEPGLCLPEEGRDEFKGVH